MDLRFLKIPEDQRLPEYVPHEMKGSPGEFFVKIVPIPWIIKKQLRKTFLPMKQ